MTALRLARERAKDKDPKPTYHRDSTQCDRPGCGHGSWDHMHEDGKCLAPGCKCQEFQK